MNKLQMDLMNYFFTINILKHYNGFSTILSLVNQRLFGKKVIYDIHTLWSQ